jgi:hypothetical protein
MKIRPYGKCNINRKGRDVGEGLERREGREEKRK